jgi:hypothetical protein
MTKPSQRHASHVQAEKKDAVEQPVPPSPAPAGTTPSTQSYQGPSGGWFALVIWTFVFGFLFVYLLIDLVVSLFRK